MIDRRKFLKWLGLVPVLANAKNLFGFAGNFYPQKNEYFIDAEKGYDYVIGIDVGMHLGDSSNPSVISVWRVGSSLEPMVQVAEIVGNGYGSNNDTTLIAAIAAGNKYGKYLSHGPLFSIEQIRSCGDILQHQLRTSGFHRFYKHIQYRPGLDKIPKEGWRSTAWSIPIMIDRFIDAYRNKYIIANSVDLRENIEFAKYDGKFLTVLSRDGYAKFHAAAIAVNSVFQDE